MASDGRSAVKTADLQGRHGFFPRVSHVPRVTGLRITEVCDEQDASLPAVGRGCRTTAVTPWEQAVGAQCATWQSEESEVVVMWLAILTHNNNNGSTKPLHTKRIPRRVSPPQPDRLGPALISTQDSGDAAQGYGGSQPREARD